MLLFFSLPSVKYYESTGEKDEDKEGNVLCTL